MKLKHIVNNVSWSGILFLIFLLLLPFLDRSEPETAPPEGEYATVTHQKYGFSIEYPTKWQVYTYNEEGKKGYDSSIKLELTISRRGPFGIYVRRNWPPTSPTLQDVSDWGTEIMSRTKTRENIVEFPDMVNGKPVIRQRYDWGDYTTEAVYIARSNDMIIISMDVKKYDYDANIDDFNAIVESFRPFE